MIPTFFNQLRENNFKIFNEYLDYEEYETTVPLFPIGGKVICKKCGKVYKWVNWGRGKSLCLTKMCRHLTTEHVKEYKLHYPLTKLFLDKWIRRHKNYKVE